MFRTTIKWNLTQETDKFTIKLPGSIFCKDYKTREPGNVRTRDEARKYSRSMLRN